jgi:phenylacetate-coenzyme A ligase PaaK-like adenylate-forming protein
MISLANRHLLQPFVAWKADSPHLKHLRTLERTQFDSLDVIRERQFAALRDVVRHAEQTVPYYRDRWSLAGVRADSLRTLDDLARFPVLTKSDIRTNADRLRSEAYRGEVLYPKTTSGSTGVPLTVHWDEESKAWKRACTLRSDQWSGWQFGTRVARLWGHGTADRGGWKARLRRFFVDRESFLNTLGIDRRRLRGFADHLRRRPPGLLFGHAHSLYLFAAFVRKHCRGTISPDGVISAAMTLHDWQRGVIEEAFGQPVTNRYGCEEVSLIACECEEHRGLHLNSDSVYCEVVPDNRLSGGPKAGRLLVTDLTNRAMPLIRYQVGDVVIPSERTCPCGRGLPLIESVVGREADYVLTPTGALISGISLTDHFATEIRGASQVQIVQEKLTFLRLRMVPGEGFGPDSHQQIETLVRNTFGPQMRYEVELVDAIPQESSGKYRFCVSPVATAYLRSLAP